MSKSKRLRGKSVDGSIVVDEKGKPAGYKKQIRILKKALNIAAVEHKVMRLGAKALKDMVQLITYSGTHGYNPACVCEPCSKVREGIETLVKAKFIDDPKDARENKLIIAP